ncbi:hypothetical protein KXV85_005833, partial [Aspergillus fumigatus]
GSYDKGIPHVGARVVGAVSPQKIAHTRAPSPTQRDGGNPMSASRKTTLPAGEAIPVLGQGTAGMGEHSGSSRDEIAALKTGIDLGMTLIDTAESYADGGAEQVVAEAIDGPKVKAVATTSALWPKPRPSILPG